MLEENEIYYQEYFIHMNNGDVLRMIESYDLEWEKGIIYAFEESQKDFLYINVGLDDVAYVPKKNICFITTGNVVKGLADFDFKSESK